MESRMSEYGEEEGEGFAQSIDNLILELDEKKEESKKRNNRGTIRIPKQEEADEFDMLIAQLDVPLQPQPEPEHAMASVQLRLQPETAIPTFRSGSKISCLGEFPAVTELTERVQKICDKVVSVIAIVRSAIPKYDMGSADDVCFFLFLLSHFLFTNLLSHLSYHESKGSMKVAIVSACKSAAESCVFLRSLTDDPNTKIIQLINAVKQIKQTAMDMLKSLRLRVDTSFVEQVAKGARGLFLLLRDFCAFVVQNTNNDEYKVFNDTTNPLSAEDRQRLGLDIEDELDGTEEDFVEWVKKFQQQATTPNNTKSVPMGTSNGPVQKEPTSTTTATTFTATASSSVSASPTAATSSPKLLRVTKMLKDIGKSKSESELLLSEPREFRHVGHIGMDATGQLESRGVPPTWTDVLEDDIDSPMSFFEIPKNLKDRPLPVSQPRNFVHKAHMGINEHGIAESRGVPEEWTRAIENDNNSSNSNSQYVRKVVLRQLPPLPQDKKFKLTESEFFSNDAYRVASYSENRYHKKWPHKQPSPENMAAAGFYFAPTNSKPDQVVCFCCDLKLSRWQPTDDPVKLHRRFNATCPVVSGEGPPEVPITVKVIKKKKNEKSIDLHTTDNFL